MRRHSGSAESVTASGEDGQVPAQALLGGPARPVVRGPPLEPTPERGRDDEHLEPATVRTAGDDLPDRLGAGCERLVRDDEEAVGVAGILDRGGVVHGGSFRDGGPSAGRAPSVLRHAVNGL